MSLKWYGVKVQSGREGVFAKKLAERLEGHPELTDSFGELLIPTEKVVELRHGKKTHATRVFYPGYVFLQMVMTPELHYFIRNLGASISLLGTKTEPTMISESEIQTIRQRMASSVDKPKSRVAFDVGQAVRVTHGPFANFEGTIQEVLTEKSKVKVGVNIFGRVTPVEVDFTQVEKL